ncbi:WD domain, G-beta repeat protein (macronuclear) [Tetrahymena thermophila SB210]|uniref:WD domain, G-beta repeat protein n=1 Tax=Tetrahymena thermophila (strain SB210) TaxID=312017 RepID=I7MDG9_TETTS|nr:WD domain, G-beta repeat protein [Tetrahymena thermophila SB210]EAR87565.1 WD domain, G-beta repeat protein [Tetrahymena thermophila SB210]|eukprot:XP_001007810.1 WD domain, G-beta repeat protein [Tetrahymena thermophila SB210]
MKKNIYFDKIKIECKLHPKENVISLCMNPYCKLNKLICGVCLSEQNHECRNKIPIHKLYDFSDEKTYTQIQVEKSDSERIDYHKNQEKELQEALERMKQLQKLKDMIVAKLDQVIEGQQKIIDGFVNSQQNDRKEPEKSQEEETQEDQKDQKQEEADEPKQEQPSNIEDNEEENIKGRTLSQISQPSSYKEAQKALQHSLIKYLEELQNDQSRDINRVIIDLSTLQLQHNSFLKQLKQQQAKHLVAKSQQDLFQMEVNAIKSIDCFNDVVKIVHKYDQIQLEGYDSYSQTSIENMMNLYRNSNPTVRSQILCECDILSVDISQDRRFLLIGCGKPKFVVLVFDIQDKNLQKPKLLASLPHSSAVQIVRISPNGLFFCSGCESSAVRMYCTQSIIYKNKNNLLKTFMDHQQAITGIQYSRDNKILVTSSLDKSLIIYDVSAPANSSILHKIKLEHPIVSFDLTVRYVLAVNTANNMCNIYQNARTNPNIIYQIPFTGCIRDVKISLNERFLCVNDYYSNCYIYDLTFWPPIIYDTIPLIHTNSIAFHQDSSNILAISKGGTNFDIYQLSTNDHPTPSQLIYSSTDHTDTVLALKFYSNYIISGGKDKKLLITEVF